MLQATLERLRQRRDERGDEGGFTLIELLIVIVILAILAAIIVFAVQNLAGSSAKASCESDVQTVDHAVQAYTAQVGTAPTSITQLEGTQPGANGETSVGPWLHNTPTNGHHYEVIVADGATTYTNWTSSPASKPPAGTVVVETYGASSFNAAPAGTVYAPPAPPTGVTGPVTTTSDACAGVTS